MAIDVGGSALTLRTDRGVFSHGRLDPGTAVLLRNAPPPPPRARSSISAAGSGVLALALARLAPRATVWAVDVNERARQLTPRTPPPTNCPTSRSPIPTVFQPTCGSTSSGRTRRSASASRHCTTLLSTWLRRLSTEGRAVLVVQKHLGADSLQRWLIDEGWPTTRLASSRGYRMLQVRSPPCASGAADRPRRGRGCPSGAALAISAWPSSSQVAARARSTASGRPDAGADRDAVDAAQPLGDGVVARDRSPRRARRTVEATAAAGAPSPDRSAVRDRRATPPVRPRGEAGTSAAAAALHAVATPINRAARTSSAIACSAAR